MVRPIRPKNLFHRIVVTGTTYTILLSKFPLFSNSFTVVPFLQRIPTEPNNVILPQQQQGSGSLLLAGVRGGSSIASSTSINSTQRTNSAARSLFLNPHNLKQQQQQQQQQQSDVFRSSSSQLNMSTQNETNNNNNSSSINVSISDAFDGGNGKFMKLVETHDDDDITTVYINIKKDPFTQLEQCHHFQYFSFRSSVRDSSSNEPIKIKYVIANAGKASYSKAWVDSTTFVSDTPSDPLSWNRKLDTSYDESTGELSWTHEHTTDAPSAYFAYFPPFSYERHLDLVSKCSKSPMATVHSLGQTLDGREMECITIGTGSKKCWIIHRQHPGETMAEYYAEGLLSRLLGLDSGYAVDGKVQDVLKLYTFYIVPNMCPDGAFRGHLRTNANGQNLNREWCSSGSKEEGTFYEAPTLERSPEVYHVLNKMDETGVDVFLDVHGDEELPYNFLAGSEGCPNWSPRLQALHGAFLSAYQNTNSDMQIPIGYEPENPGEGRMNVCSNQIAYRFDCLGATLEMPFKDCWSNPDPIRGWNPARSRMLGASVLEPLSYIAPYLREDGEFWKDAFGKEEEYMRPTSNYRSL